jgi:ATP-binding cassette subfamily B protein
MPPVKMRGVQRPHHIRTTILRLLSYMGSFKLLWPFVFICLIITAGAEVAGTYLLKPAVNNYILPFIGNKNPPLQGFMFLLLKLAVIYAAGCVSTYISSRLLLQISASTMFNIRRDLFKKQNTLPLEYFDSHTHGELMSLYTNDADTLRDMFSQSIPQLMTGFFQVTGIFVMMVCLSLSLTLVMLVSISGIVLLGTRLAKLSANAYRGQQQNLSKVNGYIEEYIEGQRVVKVFTREEKVSRDFEVLNEQLCKSGTSASTYASIFGPLMHNLSHLQYALVSGVGAVLVIMSVLDIGTIASFLQSIRSFSRPLGQLSQQFNAILNALAGAERIFKAIDEQSETDKGDVTLVNASEATLSRTLSKEKKLVQSFAYTGTWAWNSPKLASIKKLTGEVIFKGVDFSYDGRKKVLSDINLHVKPGQKIALVGSTGSGKTTITNLLTRFYDINDGEGIITYDGIPVKSIKKADLRRSLSMVLQDTHLFTDTVMENIRYGNLEASDYQVYEAARLANADTFIKHLPQGYNTVIKGDGSNLSQGQRQLLAIARAAVASPPVLILDEATSSVDTRTERLIEKGMDSLMSGRTVFVIAHRLSTVRNADCILVLENGRIIEQGNHKELLAKKGRYYALYTGAFELE